MYKKRRDRYSKLRINKFRGLNGADNPRNIDDAEASVMTNLCLTKDGTIRSRKGWEGIAGVLPLSDTVRGMHKTYWEDVGSAVYMMGNYVLCHVNEQSWVVSNLGVIGGGTEHVQFLRYKDKLLYLFPGKELKRIDSSNDINTVQMPSFQALFFETPLSASAGGALDPEQAYEYAVSFSLGADFRDGETSLSLARGAWPHDPPGYPGEHAFATTTADNKTITTTYPLKVVGTLNGYDVSMVHLFRRAAKLNSVGYYVADDLATWVYLDSAYINKTWTGDSWDYTLDADINGVITDVGGWYYETGAGETYGPDTADITVSFTDNGAVSPEEAHWPRLPITDEMPKAKYMTRLYNRILLANIGGTAQEADKKRVWYSYRGDTGLGSGEDSIWEIDGFEYAHPMLIFPHENFFYCDFEDPADEITGLATYQDNVFIFTGKCTFLWREGMFDPMKIANDVGCIANSSICEFEGKLLWLAKNGVYQYDGNKVKNLTYEKVESYIAGVNSSAAHKASATIHDRKYFLAAPFDGGTLNNKVLVYDFDLNEWYVYEYMYNLNTGWHLYIDYLFNYSDGAEETLYAGVSRDGAAQAFPVKLESGYSDYWYHAVNSSDGIPIEYELRTKYFDFEAPDIEKAMRNGFVGLCGYSGGVTLDLYVDQTDSADNSTELPVPAIGFLIAGADTVDEAALGCGILAGAEGTTGDYIENVGNVAYAISWPQGLTGAAFQLGISGEQWGSQLEIKSIGVDWLPKRKVARTIGG